LGTKSNFSMMSQTRLAILGLTVVMPLMVRETVAMETLARRAMVRISIRSGISSGAAFLGAEGLAKAIFGNRFRLRFACRQCR